MHIISASPAAKKHRTTAIESKYSTKNALILELKLNTYVVVVSL